MFLFYTYRSLTTTELEEYLNFAMSSAGSKYYLASSTGVKKALFDSSLKWEKSIADILGKLKNQPKPSKVLTNPGDPEERKAAV